jgi:septal ring factor EnvC (AmiA/AmiB activator)
MSEEQNGGGLSRLDRIERALELLIADHEQSREEHKRLLTAQVLQGERIDKLIEAQKHTDESLHTLIMMMDDLIRRRPA